MVIPNAFFGQIRSSTGERNVNIVAKFYFWLAEATAGGRRMAGD
jgi:hypothetical protein